MGEDLLALDYMPTHVWYRCKACDVYEENTKTPICFNCEKPMSRSLDPHVEFSIHNGRVRGNSSD